MKKLLSSCADCGEDKSILTKVGCAAEVIYLCGDCYNLKYSKEVQKEIEEDYLIPDFIKNQMKKNTRTFCAVFDESTTLWEIDQFVDKFRQETDKKDELVIDLDITKMGTKVFLAKHRKKEIYH